MQTDVDYDEDENYISRTAQKKATQAFVKVGEELLALSPSQLDTIPTDKVLDEALAVAKKIKVGNALKRQMSFIGKLIRKNKPEEIQTALLQLQQKDTQHEKVSRSAEKWRDRLIGEESSSLADFINAYPDCDKQRLNQLTRNAIKEHKNNQQLMDKDQAINNKHSRILFVFLRECIN